MQHSPEALQQEIKALEERLQQARRALQELQGGSAQDDELELIELSESDIIDEPEDDQLVERFESPLQPVADPWAGIAVNVPESSVDVADEVTSVEEAWPEVAPAARDPLMTGTLAELYVSQGFTDKAVNIYRDILSAEPDNTTVAARLAELEAQVPENQSVPPSNELTETLAIVPDQVVATTGSIVSVLEGWLENIRRLRECR